MTEQKVKGYTDQTDYKVYMVNTNKEIEERLLRTVDNYKNTPEIDKHWLNIAKTHFEQGFMAMNRAVFQPQRIRLPEDE